MMLLRTLLLFPLILLSTHLHSNETVGSTLDGCVSSVLRKIAPLSKSIILYQPDLKSLEIERDETNVVVYFPKDSPHWGILGNPSGLSIRECEALFFEKGLTIATKASFRGDAYYPSENAFFDDVNNYPYMWGNPTRSDQAILKNMIKYRTISFPYKLVVWAIKRAE